MTILKARLNARGRRLGLLRGSGTASEVAQESVARLLDARSLPRFHEPRVFSAYLWRVAWRLLMKRASRAWRERGEAPDLPPGFHGGTARDGAVTNAERGELAHAVRFALHLLPPGERRVLEMSYFEHRSTAEVAEALGVSPEAAAMRLVRARRKLAPKLARWRRLLDA